MFVAHLANLQTHATVLLCCLVATLRRECRSTKCFAMQGLIDPAAPEGTAASVFAVFDEGKKLQYVGFSKDIRNSLRTVFSRRPDKVFFYKCGFHGPHAMAGLGRPSQAVFRHYVSELTSGHQGARARCTMHG